MGSLRVMGVFGKNREILALFALVVFLGCDQRSSLRSSLIGLTDGGGEPPGNGGGGEPPSGRELPFSLTGVSHDQGVRPGLTQTDFNLDIPTAQYTSNRMGATQPSFSPDGLLMFSGDGSFSDGSRGLRVSIVDYRATSEVQGKLDFVTKTGSAANPLAFPMHRYLQLGTGGACGSGIYRRVPIAGCTNWRVTLDDPARADDGQADRKSVV